MDRRDVLRWASAGPVASGSNPLAPLWAKEKPLGNQRPARSKITDISTVLTSPNQVQLDNLPLQSLF